MGPTDFLRVEDELTGEIRVEKGPQVRPSVLLVKLIEIVQVFIPGPYDKFGGKEEAITLRHNQYVK